MALRKNNVDSLLVDISDFLGREIGVCIEQSGLAVSGQKDWDKAIKDGMINPGVNAKYEVKTASAFINGDHEHEEALLINHFYGNGLFCEHSKL